MALRNIGDTTFWLLRRLRHTDRPMSSEELHDRLGGELSENHIYRILRTLLRHGFVTRHKEGARFFYAPTDKWAPDDPLPIPKGCTSCVWGHKYGLMSLGDAIALLRKGSLPVRVTHPRRRHVELRILRSKQDGVSTPFIVRDNTFVFATFANPYEALHFAQEFFER